MDIRYEGQDPVALARQVLEAHEYADSQLAQYAVRLADAVLRPVMNAESVVQRAAAAMGEPYDPFYDSLVMGTLASQPTTAAVAGQLVAVLDEFGSEHTGGLTHQRTGSREIVWFPAVIGGREFNIAVSAEEER